MTGALRPLACGAPEQTPAPVRGRTHHAHTSPHVARQGPRASPHASATQGRADRATSGGPRLGPFWLHSPDRSHTHTDSRTRRAGGDAPARTVPRAPKRVGATAPADAPTNAPATRARTHPRAGRCRTPNAGSDDTKSPEHAGSHFNRGAHSARHTRTHTPSIQPWRLHIATHWVRFLCYLGNPSALTHTLRLTLLNTKTSHTHTVTVRLHPQITSEPNDTLNGPADRR